MLLEFQREVKIGRFDLLLENDLIEDRTGDVLASFRVLNDKGLARFHQVNDIFQHDVSRRRRVVEASVGILFDQYRRVGARLVGSFGWIFWFFQVSPGVSVSLIISRSGVVKLDSNASHGK